MTASDLMPVTGIEILSPAERFRRVMAAASAGEQAAAALEGLGLDDIAARDAALEAHDAACTQLIDLLCDPGAAELLREIDGFLTVAYGRAG